MKSLLHYKDEALIRKAIEEFARNRTTFLITHSLGSLQFDPLEVAGRNHDLVLLARIADYRRPMTEALLYERVPANPPLLKVDSGAGRAGVDPEDDPDDERTRDKG